MHALMEILESMRSEVEQFGVKSEINITDN